jgi:SAM-dependent methyltransferase
LFMIIGMGRARFTADEGMMTHRRSGSTLLPRQLGKSLLETTLGGTLLVGAFLLFVVEPMFAKMVLPLLGGSPAVWNTCMLFFQSMLLLGYLYAHLGPRLLGVRRHAVFHVVAVGLSLFALPITIRSIGSPPVAGSPIAWLIQVLVLSLGVPFLLLSSTGPLVQQWFSAVRRSASSDPYFLYSASNVGSLVGLVAYPAIIEASLPLTRQAHVWTVGYVVFLALIAGSAFALWYSPLASHQMSDLNSRNSSETDGAATRSPWAERIGWVTLAFVPSSLMLGLTTYVTMDIAAVPLLWVVPFAVYLVTFVIAFSRVPLVRQEQMVRSQPLLLIPLVIFICWGSYLATLAFLPLHLAAFFVTAMVCHGELAARRPTAAQLTEYYLWLSLGGALGGAFNVLVAPNIFKSVLEYPLLLVFACFLRPRASRSSGAIAWNVLGVVVGAAALVWARDALGPFDKPGARVPTVVSVGVIAASCFAAVGCYRVRYQPVMLGSSLGAIVAASVLADTRQYDLMLKRRDFYGIHQVRYEAADSTHVLLNGTTKHGAQSFAPGRRREPLSYYTRTGPLGDVFRELPARHGRAIAVVGLGTGATLAYGLSGERWTVYEIDPEVERIARNPRYFSYVADSPAQIDIVLGDGRLSLARARDSSFDLIVLDAFSSDAIPVHLLTREAVALYFRKLAPGGALVFHLSNRYLALEPVLARLAESAGAVARTRANTVQRDVAQHTGEDPSVWAVVATDSQSLARLSTDSRWRPLRKRRKIDIWTDDFSNVLQTLTIASPF